MTDLDQILHQCVEDIWFKFDTDQSNALDYIECRRFVNFILGSRAEQFTEQEFRLIFQEFDKDGDEQISRPEMWLFLKQVLKLEY